MDRQSNSDDEPYYDDVSDIEYDEHGNPTPAQIKRWDELRAAAANKWLNEVTETIAEVDANMPRRLPPASIQVPT